MRCGPRGDPLTVRVNCSRVFGFMHLIMWRRVAGVRDVVGVEYRERGTTEQQCEMRYSTETARIIGARARAHVHDPVRRCANLTKMTANRNTE